MLQNKGIASEKGLQDSLGFHPACDYQTTKKFFVAAPWGNIWVEIEGQGDPVFMINGGPLLDHRYFHPFLSSLADNFTVVYIDLPGRFMSDYPKDSIVGLERDIEAIEVVRQHLGFSCVNLIGHSFGGYTSIAYALRYCENVSKIITICTPLGATMEDFEKDYQAKMDEFKDVKTKDDNQRVLERRNLYKTHDGDTLKHFRAALRDMGAYEKYKMLAEVFNDAWEREWQNILGPSFPIVRIEHIPCSVPLLVLHGKHDSFMGQVIEFVKACVNSRIVIFEESSHMPFIDEPEMFDNVVREFLLQTELTCSAAEK